MASAAMAAPLSCGCFPVADDPTLVAAPVTASPVAAASVAAALVTAAPSVRVTMEGTNTNLYASVTVTQVTGGN